MQDTTGFPVTSAMYGIAVSAFIGEMLLKYYKTLYRKATRIRCIAVRVFIWEVNLRDPRYRLLNRQFIAAEGLNAHDYRLFVCSHFRIAVRV